MILSPKQIQELNVAAKPLMDFLTKHCHPHCTIVVDAESAEVFEALARVIRGKTFPPVTEAPGKDVGGKYPEHKPNAEVIE